ncbi:MAG: NB-ARC domain-containing protein [Ilumatobacteraceae bacterium]
MAVHTGEAQLRDEGNYFGQAVIRCARIRAVGHGDQVLLSDATATLVAGRLPDGASVVDLGLHRLKDLGRAERIWQLAHVGLTRDFPRLRSLDAFRQNLPTQLTPMIGRVGEVAQIGELVEHERLVTLTGSGGVGKTRLALEVAADAVERLVGGVWFVELAGVSGAGSIARAVLAALGVPETPGIAAVEQIAGELVDGRSLIVLDNCEHVVNECAEVVTALLSSSSEVAVLATSREPLGVTGEVTWRVPSLATPPPERVLDVATLSQYDAVRLFVERARRARPSFAVTDVNAPVLAEICHRLDGIPLAIELAAARCRQMTPERISAELVDRFRLLTGGARALMARQQTLAASVEWSVELLDDVERRVFRRLGVFVGSFSLEAAEAVATTFGDVETVEVFDVLCRLVDKSLVVADDEDAQDSYRLLETLRAFAIGRARDAGELMTLRDAHALWWAEWLENHNITGPTDTVVAAVDAQRDNLNAALDWASTRDPELGLRMLRLISRALQGTGRYGDAMAAADRLLIPENAERYPALWVAAANSASIPVLYTRGQAAFAELLALVENTATALDDDYHLAVARWLTDMNVATSETLRDRARERGEPYLEALATVRLAIDLAENDPILAEPALLEAERIAAAYGSRYLREFALVARAVALETTGELTQAIASARELMGSRTTAMVYNGVTCLAHCGLLVSDEEIRNEALEAAERVIRRSPGMAVDVNFNIALLRRDQSSISPDPADATSAMSLWLHARHALDSDEGDAAVTAVRAQLDHDPHRAAICEAIEAAFRSRCAALAPRPRPGR